MLRHPLLRRRARSTYLQHSVGEELAISVHHAGVWGKQSIDVRQSVRAVDMLEEGWNVSARPFNLDVAGGTIEPGQRCTR